MTGAPLAPVSIAAEAKGFGRLPFAFGPKFFIALLIGLVWIVPAWWEPRAMWGMAAWDALVLALWLIDLRNLPGPEQLTIRREWKSALSLAERGGVRIEIGNRSKRELVAIASDEIPSVLREPPPALEAVVPERGQTTGEYPVLPRMRGNLQTGRTFLRYRTSRGFAEKRAVADTAQVVRVLPGLTQARNFALYLIRSRQIELEKRRRHERGQGRDFEALRDYREGDEMRDICWTATARRHQPTTRVYRTERSQTVWIVVNSGRLLRALVKNPDRAFPSSKLDYAVDAALSLAMVATQSGDKVGLLAYGRGVQRSVAPGRGGPHVRTILEALADVHGEAAEADHARAAQALSRAQTRRALIVWLTDFSETATTPEVIEYAIRLATKHVVVFAAIGQPDLDALARKIPENTEEMFRHAAALEVAQRRERLLRTLRERGVAALDIPAAGVAAAVVNRYLEVKERGRI